MPEPVTAPTRPAAVAIHHSRDSPVEDDTARSSRSSSSSVEENILNVVEQEDIPPNGGYGWVCTAAVFLINAHTWGINSAWAIFLAHYLRQSTFQNATPIQFALIGGLSISQALLVTPAIALSNRLLGTRTSLLIGTTLVSVAMLAASYATQIWHLFLSQGVCFGWGMGFLYVTATGLLPAWFSSRRSLALGFASAGAGLGGLAYNLSTARAIETLGLPWAYRILAICAFAANGASSLALRDRNRFVKPRDSAFNYREYGCVEVLLVIAWGLLTELGFVVLLFSLPNYAASVGLSPRQGSVVGAMLNLGLGVGRPAVGYLSDRYGRINVAGLITAACGVLCLALWVPATTYGALIAFALTAGVCCGIFWNAVAPVTAEVVGLQRLPSSFGMICLALVPAAIFAEPIALEMVGHSGYQTAQIFVGCMYVLAAASVWLLRSWKMLEIEQKAIAERLGERARGSVSGLWLSPRRLFVGGRF